MPDRYRIFGVELSPYSVKVRSYFRYKGIPHEWVVRSPINQGEFEQKYGTFSDKGLVTGCVDSMKRLHNLSSTFGNPMTIKLKGKVEPYVEGEDEQPEG